MGRAVGWTLLILLVVVIGTNPGTAVTLAHHFLQLVDQGSLQLLQAVGQFVSLEDAVADCSDSPG